MQDGRVAGLDVFSPGVFEHVIGQQRVVGILRTMVAAYFQDRAAGRVPPTPHMLFCGPSGVGKTLAAYIYHKERASNIIEVTGESLVAGLQLRKLLLSLADDEVLFIDEIHTLRGPAEAILLKALSERKLCLDRGPFSKRPKVLSLSRFQCIGATTDPWCLSSPLRQRFLVLNFEYYSEQELVALLKQRVHALGWRVEDGVIEALARRGKQTPRICLSMLQACYRQARSENKEAITLEHLHTTMDMFQIDELGLDAVEQGYLRVLAGSDGPVRLNVLASKLGLPTNTIRKITESALLRQDLIEKHPSGRVLTRKGMEHLQRTGGE